jgi:hypothetical protein
MKREQIDHEEDLTMQRTLLLAYSSWLAKHQRLTFTPERLVEAYMGPIKPDTEGHAT